MAPVQPFYLPDPSSDGPDRFASTPSTGGPWSESSQHGGPPAALLVRALERLARADGRPERVLGRFTMDLLGPVPVGPLEVVTEVLRPGRSVELCQATVYPTDPTGARARACARGTTWLFPAHREGPVPLGEAPGHAPTDGSHREPPASWARGYLDAIEWSWVSGSITEPGPGVVWMRPRVALVEGEPMSPVQRLMTCVDSASGVSSAVDPETWTFLNTDLTVHVLRPPVGEWVCLDAETTLGPGSVGIAASRVYDEQGLVARSAQALLVVPRG